MTKGEVRSRDTILFDRATELNPGCSLRAARALAAGLSRAGSPHWSLGEWGGNMLPVYSPMSDSCQYSRGLDGEHHQWQRQRYSSGLLGLEATVGWSQGRKVARGRWWGGAGTVKSGCIQYCSR